VTISAGRVEIVSGRSGVVLSDEGEHTLVLLHGESEVRRARIEFPAGGVHELRL
jgi:hypothetical protein